MPLPGSGIETIATCLFGLTIALVGPLAVALSSSMPFCTAGEVTSLASTTASAGSGPPGNAAWMRS